jgi:lysophospholipase L1-like esterase
LLYRDLDFVLERAEEVGATVVLLNYPNPSDDHTALREILSDYAADRSVEYVDTYGRFAERFAESPQSWQAQLGPNGHANQYGYRLMAEDILEHLKRRKILNGVPVQP